MQCRPGKHASGWRFVDTDDLCNVDLVNTPLGWRLMATDDLYNVDPAGRGPGVTN